MRRCIRRVFTYLSWRGCLALLAGQELPRATSSIPVVSVAVKAATNAPSLFLPIPKSNFAYDLLARGRDPFNRAGPEFLLPLPRLSPGPESNSLVLKGIILGPKKSRLALINNSVVRIGESAVVTTKEGKVNIRCDEIEEDHVMLMVTEAGRSVTIKLRMENNPVIR